MTQALVKIEDTAPQIPLLPSRKEIDEIIERATYIADKLAAIVQSRNWFAEIDGKRYLEVEAWQFIGFQAGIDSTIDYTRPVTGVDGMVVAYESKAILMRGGEVFSSGIMECGLDAFPTRGKQGREKVKAAQSASQTWAISKAYRNRLSFIARMAGFEPTPADEMRQTTTTTSRPDYLKYCPEHTEGNNAWFKKGKMKTPAHITPSRSWCNQPEAYERKVKDLAQALGWDAPTLTSFLKSKGDPLSSLNAERQVAIIYDLEHRLSSQNMPPSQAPESPTSAPEGQGMGDTAQPDLSPTPAPDPQDIMSIKTPEEMWREVYEACNSAPGFQQQLAAFLVRAFPNSKVSPKYFSGNPTLPAGDAPRQLVRHVYAEFFAKT